MNRKFGRSAAEHADTATPISASQQNGSLKELVARSMDVSRLLAMSKGRRSNQLVKPQRNAEPGDTGPGTALRQMRHTFNPVIVAPASNNRPIRAAMSCATFILPNGSSNDSFQ